MNEKYNTDELFRLLKNDETKIKRSTQEFLYFCQSALEASRSALITNNFEETKSSFHNILNLGEFFGTNDLVTLIRNFKQGNKENLRAIITELENVMAHFSI